MFYIVYFASLSSFDVVGNPGRILRLNFDVVVRYKITWDIKNFVIEKFNLLGGVEISKVVYP